MDLCGKLFQGLISAFLVVAPMGFYNDHRGKRIRGNTLDKVIVKG